MTTRLSYTLVLLVALIGCSDKTADVSGMWDITVLSGEGLTPSLPDTWIVTQAGSQLTGDILNDNRDIGELSGTVSGDSVVLTLTWSDGPLCNPSGGSVEAKVDGTMTGVGQWSAGKDSCGTRGGYNIKFVGRRR